MKGPVSGALRFTSTAPTGGTSSVDMTLLGWVAFRRCGTPSMRRVTAARAVRCVDTRNGARAGHLLRYDRYPQQNPPIGRGGGGENTAPESVKDLSGEPTGRAGRAEAEAVVPGH